MKTLKKVSILASASILAGMIAFTACKKEKQDKSALGKKAAIAVCDCMDKKTNQAKAICINDVYDKYEKYEDDDKFNKAFSMELLKCDDFWDWAEENGLFGSAKSPKSLSTISDGIRRQF